MANGGWGTVQASSTAIITQGDEKKWGKSQFFEKEGFQGSRKKSEANRKGKCQWERGKTTEKEARKGFSTESEGNAGLRTAIPAWLGRGKVLGEGNVSD